MKVLTEKWFSQSDLTVCINAVIKWVFFGGQAHKFMLRTAPTIVRSAWLATIDERKTSKPFLNCPQIRFSRYETFSFIMCRVRGSDSSIDSLADLQRTHIVCIFIAFLLLGLNGIARWTVERCLETGEMNCQPLFLNANKCKWFSLQNNKPNEMKSENAFN